MDQKSIFTAKEAQELLKGKKKPKQKEEKVQLAVCDYIREKYPDVIFTCDLASGMKLPIHIGARHKRMRSSRGLPDLFIAHPIVSETRRSYNGLFIEIKQASVRLKNGSIARSDHHNEQAEILYRLKQKGYAATFGCGFQECKEIIDNYMLGMYD